ncbi:MAG: acetylglutamate kinase [Chthoniobacterales bacterium]|nr:acetylglutamate kinase [Chthoniobacterales bacterium]
MIHDQELEKRAAILIEALPYIQKFRRQTFVIKYGGSAMEETHQVERLLRDIVFLEAVGIKPVLLHGGGKAISRRMREAGLEPRFVNGLRITDQQTIEIVRAALDDEINPFIVQTIRSYGGKAQGLSGKDVFLAKPLEPQLDDSGNLIDLGFVGEAHSVDLEEVFHLLQNDTVPVISPIGSTDDGILLNINADIAAAALAVALKASKLIYVSDVRGILRSPSDPSSLIPTVHIQDIHILIQDNVLTGGMIPKVQSAVTALKKGVSKIHFICGAIPHCLLLEIFTDKGIGTEITL